ncbi:MAG TPA: carbohydrate-binding domain-containing protein, partial [Acetobacteraceae bacterium]
MAAPSTPFPLGYFGTNPDGSSEAAFNAQYDSFVQAMGGARPTFFDAFVDFGKDPSEWGANAGWTAWSFAMTGNQDLGPGSGATPVVGVPLASNAGGWSNVDTFYQGIISGQYDADYKAVIDAWAEQGYKSVDVRIAYEFNGNFMAWAPGNSGSPSVDADFVKAWQHVADLVHQEGQAKGITAKTVWNPCDINWTAYDVKSLYPGDQYVDIIATDAYSPVYPNDLTNWASGGTAQAADLTTWAANPVNRAHFWQYSNATSWAPQGTPGSGWSFQNTVDFAKAHNKPIALGETGAGGNGTTTGPVDDPAFPQWLAGALQQAQTQGVQVAFVNVWDGNMSDGNWQFSGPGASKPLEAAAWDKYFGAGASSGSTTGSSTPPTGSTGSTGSTGGATGSSTPVAVGTGADQLVLNISEDRYANRDTTSDANGDATFVVLVDGKQIGGTLSATAMHSLHQTQPFTVKGNFGTGTHNVEVRLTNDAWSGVSSATTDRNIYVDGVTYNGKAVAYTGQDVNGAGARFTVSGGTSTTGGTGSTGSTGSTTGSSSPPTGSTGNTGSTGSSTGAGTPATVGTGADQLVLHISEDRYANHDTTSDANGDATFVVLVDGKQIGGTLSATAMHSLHQTQPFTVKGNFGTGTHN